MTFRLSHSASTPSVQPEGCMPLQVSPFSGVRPFPVFRDAFPIAVHTQRLPHLLRLLLTSHQAPRRFPVKALPSLRRAALPVRSPQIRARTALTSRLSERSGPHLPFPRISRASSCGADSPSGRALYAISVRRLVSLASGFLQPHLRRCSLAFRSQLFYPDSPVGTLSLAIISINYGLLSKPLLNLPTKMNYTHFPCS